MISSFDRDWASEMINRYADFTWMRRDEILRRVSLEDIASARGTYSRLPFSSFVSDMDKLMQRELPQTNLKRLRTEKKLSQGDLSRESGVKLRNIQMYEQRCHDINRASGIILYRLSKALGCTMEELLENPGKSDYTTT